jgi:O-antigen ligase
MHDELLANGVYQIFRLSEYLIVLIATAKMAMNPFRWAAFRWIALSTFCFASAGVLLTITGLVGTNLVTPLLPVIPSIAGPWAAFASGSIKDSGFISFNHGYAGIQLILSGGAAYLFFEQSKHIRLLICSLLLLSTFASMSRASFVVAVLLVLALEWKKPDSNLTTMVLILSLCGFLAVHSLTLGDTVERQTSSASSMEEDGLSGRTDIWQEHFSYFKFNPLNIIVGTGFGYTAKTHSDNAHMLYLHVLTETGSVGLLFFIYLQRRTLLLLQDRRTRAMRLTVWALLLTGLTQETLYPVATFSHFLGFYLSALAVTLRYAGNFEARPALSSGCHIASLRFRGGA